MDLQTPPPPPLLQRLQRLQPAGRAVRQLLSDWAALAWPRICPITGLPLPDRHLGFAPYLEARLPRTGFEHRPLDNPAAALLAHLPQVQAVVPLARYHDGPLMRQLVWALKYDQQPRIGHQLGHLLGRLLQAQPWARQAAAVVPVPLHRRRLAERGYNQSEWLASGLAHQLGVPVWPRLLQRRQHTPTQTRLDRAQRQLNLRDAFAVQGPLPPCLWVVDDVLTTGSTLAEVAQCLQRAGVTRIFMATAAYANLLD